MQASELAQSLKTRYDQAPSRDKAAHVVLFGIENAEALAGHSVAEVTTLSGIGTRGPQVALGKKLAKYVDIKP